MRTVRGDLVSMALRGQVEVVVHGCNCFGVMGAGLARRIRNELPAAYRVDRATRRGDRSKLGTCTAATCETAAGSVVVVNAYTQYDYRGPGVRVDYEAVRSCLAWVASEFGDRRIGLPRIGAGLARGDWSRILGIVSEELDGADVTVVEYDGGRSERQEAVPTTGGWPRFRRS